MPRPASSTLTQGWRYGANTRNSGDGNLNPNSRSRKVAAITRTAALVEHRHRHDNGSPRHDVPPPRPCRRPAFTGSPDSADDDHPHQVRPVVRWQAPAGYTASQMTVDDDRSTSLDSSDWTPAVAPGAVWNDERPPHGQLLGGVEPSGVLDARTGQRRRRLQPCGVRPYSLMPATPRSNRSGRHHLQVHAALHRVVRPDPGPNAGPAKRHVAGAVATAAELGPGVRQPRRRFATCTRPMSKDTPTLYASSARVGGDHGGTDITARLRRLDSATSPVSRSPSTSTAGPGLPGRRQQHFVGGLLPDH